MTTLPINRTPGADGAIIRSLWVIRHAKEPLPAFARGLMFYDFDAGKVRIAPKSSGEGRV